MDRIKTWSILAMPSVEPEPKIVAVVPAWNEASVLAQTLASLREATPQPDLVVVIADHCTDDTADVAEQFGATVLRRQSGPNSKGAALKWMFGQAVLDLARSSVVAIFDADTRVAPSFFFEIRQAFRRGARVVQGFVQPLDIPNSPTVVLMAYSQLLTQRIDDGIRARLGGSVRLRGTGMAIEAGLLIDLLPLVQTRSEDMELTLLLAARGVRIVSLPSAVVFDPMPSGFRPGSRQRARWLRGQFDTIRAHGRQLGRLLRQGPAGWWLLQDLFLKPRTLLGLALLLVSIAAWLVPGGRWLAIPPGLLLALMGTYYVAGLLVVPPGDRARFARALLLAPLYVGMWCGSVLMAWRRPDAWHSVRHD
jgi:cellulose synthase/poly-beta-1,6-N-acetylglucosamine synthase-like glycosyltransferase